MAKTTIKSLEAQVNALAMQMQTLVEVLATQGASVTVTETKKPAKKSRKKKKAPAWSHYSDGKENRKKRLYAIKELLRASCEADDNFRAWTWAQLTECADDNGVDYSHLCK